MVLQKVTNFIFCTRPHPRKVRSTTYQHHLLKQPPNALFITKTSSQNPLSAPHNQLRQTISHRAFEKYFWDKYTLFSQLHRAISHRAFNFDALYTKVITRNQARTQVTASLCKSSWGSNVTIVLFQVAAPCHHV